MSIDNVSIIPPTAAALAAVETPFVSFTHPFKVRIGSIERQIEAMRCYMAIITLGDVWPDSFHDALNWGRTHPLFATYTQPQERWCICLWPETAVYMTDTAKLLGVNESVKYRPQLWTFCQYFEKFSTGEDCDFDVLPEGSIYVADRQLYPATYPMLELLPEDRELSIVALGGRPRGPTPNDAEIIYHPDISGDAFNWAMQQATGRYVMCMQGGDRQLNDRAVRQLEDAADLSLGAIMLENGELKSWGLRDYTFRTDLPVEQFGTMMFRRDVFRTIPGAHPDMTAGFDYDLYVRIVSDARFDVVMHRAPLIERVQTFPYGQVYTQQVYNDAANRVRYERDYHAVAVRAAD